MRASTKGSLIALLLITAISCGRSSDDYRSFVASHDAIRPGMSIPQVFEAGLADYLIQSGGKNVPGSTLPEKMPVSSVCRRHVIDIHYGPGDGTSRGGFAVRIYCNMNGPSDSQLVPPGLFSTKRDFLDGLDQYARWMRSMHFSVESPALKVGGVYDSYEFVIDERGKVTSVSAIMQTSR